jgi:hypothetical protein
MPVSVQLRLNDSTRGLIKYENLKNAINAFAPGTPIRVVP